MKLSDIVSSDSSSSVKSGYKPLVRRLPVQMQVKSKEYKTTAKGHDAIVVELEIIAPETVKATNKDKSVLEYNIIGQTVMLWLQWHDENARANLTQFVSIIGVPSDKVELNPEDVTTLDWFDDLAISAYVGSSANIRQIHNADTGKMEDQKDENGKPVSGNPQWNMLNVNDITGRVARRNPL
jgi:hypothetical protein